LNSARDVDVLFYKFTNNLFKIFYNIQAEVEAGKTTDQGSKKTAQLCKLAEEASSEEGSRASLPAKKDADQGHHPLRVSSIKDSREILEAAAGPDKEKTKPKCCSCCVLS
jgi:hypothetical protein